MKKHVRSRIVIFSLLIFIIILCVYFYSSPKKIIIEEKIMNDSKYCNYLKENLDTDCACQEGYVRINTGLYPDCHPEICTLIKSRSLSGDVWVENSLICVNALKHRNYTYCDNLLNEYDIGICYLAYVGLTNETSLCSKIEDERIEKNCKE